MLKQRRFNMAWDATITANHSNNTYPMWLLKLAVALMGYRLVKDCWGGWEFQDRDSGGVRR